MQRKINIIFLSLLYACVFFSVMIPAKASESDAEHVCTVRVVAPGSKHVASYSYENDMFHKVRYVFHYMCQECGKGMGEGDVYESEGHKFMSYESEGHFDDSHNYKIICGFCGYSRHITIPCIYNATGKHTPPF